MWWNEIWKLTYYVLCCVVMAAYTIGVVFLSCRKPRKPPFALTMLTWGLQRFAMQDFLAIRFIKKMRKKKPFVLQLWQQVQILYVYNHDRWMTRIFSSNINYTGVRNKSLLTRVFKYSTLMVIYSLWAMYCTCVQVNIGTFSFITDVVCCCI